MFPWRFTSKQFHVRVNHDADELVKSHFWFPAENFFCFGGITDQEIYFRGTLITWVVFDKFLPRLRAAWPSYAVHRWTIPGTTKVIVRLTLEQPIKPDYFLF